VVRSGAIRSVAYGVAYRPHNGPVPAVLSVAEVRLGNTSVFQDRSIRPLWHLSAREFVLRLPRGTGVAHEPGLRAQVWSIG